MKKEFIFLAIVAIIGMVVSIICFLIAETNDSIKFSLASFVGFGCLACGVLLIDKNKL
jgi:hypothetical protein